MKSNYTERSLTAAQISAKREFAELLGLKPCSIRTEIESQINMQGYCFPVLKIRFKLSGRIGKSIAANKMQRIAPQTNGALIRWVCQCYYSCEMCENCSPYKCDTPKRIARMEV